MEFAIRTSLRGPLADCTNTISVAAVAHRNSLSSAAKTSAVGVFNSSKPKTKSKPLTSSSSLNSNTSTGSNNPPHVSSLLSDSDLPSPPTLLSDSVENQKLDAQKRKDKGKKVLDSPSNDTSNSLRLLGPLTSSSGNFRISNHPVTAIQKLNAPKGKDKRKMVQETVDIEASEPSTPRASSPSAASGTRDQERPVFLTVDNHRRARQRKPADGMTMVLSGPTNKRTKNKGLELDDNCVKKNYGSHTDPLPLCKKKQSGKKCDNDSAYTSMSTIPQDNIDRLIAYYAEIDKFELIVEVASESDC